MEGACIYINSFHDPVLIMYKEYISSQIFLLLYTNYQLYYSFTNSKNLTNIIPIDCIHILTKLPFDYSSIKNTIDIWKYNAINALKNYKTENSKTKNSKTENYNKYKNYKTDFYKKFSI